MKKLSILFLSALTLGITAISCSKDEAAKTPEASIEGKWTFATVQVLDSSNQPTGDVQICAGINGGVDNTCSVVKFDAMTFNAGSAAKNAVYTDYPTTGCDPQNIDFKYVKAGTSLSLDFGGTTPLNSEIMSLTSTVLKLKISENGTNYQLILNKA